MPPRARPLSRSQLAFESLLEREDDGQDPVQLPRGLRNPKKKKERGGGGGGGGGRDVFVLDERELAERRRAAASSAAVAAASPSAPSAAFDELQARFPGAPRDLLSDVLGGTSSGGGGVEEAAEALRSLGLVGGEKGGEEKTEETTHANNPSPPFPPPPPRTPAMLTEGLWGGLPPDMQRLIYARLGPRDAARAALACREFAARARAARAGPRAVVEVSAPRASLRAIEGQVAAFRGARSVSLARWRAHLDAFEVRNAAGAAAEAASAAARQGRHWQRRRWQQQLQQQARSSSSSSSSAASALPPQLRVADPDRVLEAIEGALGAVARGSERRAALVASSSSAAAVSASNDGGQGEEENGAAAAAAAAAANPFYVPTLDDGAEAPSVAAEVEHLTFPRLSHSCTGNNGSGNGGSCGDCSLPLEHCERLARRAREILPGLLSVRFDDVGGGDGPKGLCRGLTRQTDSFAGQGSENAADDDDGDEEDENDEDEDVAPPRATTLHSIAITGAPCLDDESVRALLRSWSSTCSSAAPKKKKNKKSSEELLAVDFSRCPTLTSAAFPPWPRVAAPRDRPSLRFLKSVTLDGCKRIERFELNSGTFPSLERLSLRDCSRLAEIVVVVAAAAPLGQRQASRAPQLVELRVSGCTALRSIASAAALPRLERLAAAGCASLVALPQRPSPALVEANFFGCRALLSLALEAFLGTAGTAAETGDNAATATAAATAAAASSRLASLNLNGCMSLSRVRVASAALEALDASGCRSCAEVELNIGCCRETLRSLRLDGCRELRRLSLPGEPGRGGFVAGAGTAAAFLDPAATSAAGVSEEVAALVAAATVKAKKGKKKKNET